MPATHDDAVLMLELAKWGSMIGIEEAAREVFSDDFDIEAAEVSDPSVGKLLNYGGDDRDSREERTPRPRARL